ncbi:MAG: hypothetical protein ACIAQF_03875 [Phycisphaerales bacterium JB065]
MTPSKYLALLLLAGFGALAGCNVVAPVAMVIEGPPTVPAVYELDPERPTVIFIDDRHNVLPKRSLRTDIARVTEKVFLDSKIIFAGNLIDHRSAMRVAAREDPNDPLSIVEVGRRVGAEVVIYISFNDFAITRDRVSVHPLCNAEVMIFDTVSNTKLLPQGEGAYPMRTSLPTKTSPYGSLSIAEKSETERELASGVGLRLARLFFEYEMDRDLTN